jgi:recombination protein RecR
VKEGTVREMILALSATVAGQTTAHYVAERVNALAQNADGSAANHPHGVATITKLAHGIPMGAELDYMDDGTLSAALNARLAY